MKTSSKLLFLVLFLCLFGQVLPSQYAWNSTGITGSTGRISITDSGHIFIVAGNGSVYRSTDNGGSWDNVSGASWTDYGVLAIKISKTGSVYVGLSAGGGVYRSTDDGNSWKQIRSALQVEAIDLNDRGDIFLGVSTGEGAFRSTDDGTTWMPIDSGFQCSATVFTFAIDKSKTIFAATWCGIYQSTDNGDYWTRSDTDLPPDIPRTLAVDSAGGVLVGFYMGGTYRTTDHGTNWRPINTGINNYNVNALAVAPNGSIFAGTDGGVCYSTNSGTSWVDITSGALSGSVYAVAVTKDGTLFAGTAAGLFKGVEVPNKVTGKEQNAPESFMLFQNYPNPFNPSTTIDFSLSRPGLVKIKIFSLLGEEIATLVSDNLASGTHKAIWDASAIPSGMYFCRMTCGTFTDMKKIILLK